MSKIKLKYKCKHRKNGSKVKLNVAISTSVLFLLGVIAIVTIPVVAVLYLNH